jgi:hypothetical protein
MQSSFSGEPSDGYVGGKSIDCRSQPVIIGVNIADAHSASAAIAVVAVELAPSFRGSTESILPSLKSAAAIGN